ncbi:hypothetical protein DFR95_002965 [Clostridium beijerinckii]|uniref:hypothetical protein n=1 Tax=Clostridium beijerinckii TaxID=1520 RepID=UPI001F4C0786|nr:hypothetical protein [Clostridium beijerinckii]NRZ54316.1 hypothetical protein [Clostridium beijerinckii]
MRIKVINSYPACIWEEDIIKAIHDLCLEELQEKLEKYKSDNSSKAIANCHISKKRVLLQKTSIYRNDSNV